MKNKRCRYCGRRRPGKRVVGVLSYSCRDVTGCLLALHATIRRDERRRTGDVERLNRFITLWRMEPS